ncbi:hypothetical protein [Tahibacter aquaticus]|uniref:hypothetical protein n=1 Tax=Tahibacter aquaticus TaxID=520092 RepID=UPI001414E280|nr:hypothetical protein [Tahibacter aquaticus]
MRPPSPGGFAALSPMRKKPEQRCSGFFMRGGDGSMDRKRMLPPSILPMSPGRCH